MKISCQSAMSGELLLDLELEPSNSLLLVREQLVQKTHIKEPFSLILEGQPLRGRESLEANGLKAGSVVEVIQQGIPGWTCICHGDEVGRETSGDFLIWDVPFKEVAALSAQATRVRIQERGKPEMAVESLPDSYPIQDLRRGVPIGYGRALMREEVDQTWTSPTSCGTPAPTGIASTTTSWSERSITAATMEEGYIGTGRSVDGPWAADRIWSCTLMSPKRSELGSELGVPSEKELKCARTGGPPPGAEVAL
ncbi:unnamed protein product [Durusdinium trenchii]|uniref:Ubiquitin-like domain-containing protein n=1 Tax=Durusdinium trenchii TaxID=1381693 RepID=A0ABP0R8M7_9DINO